MRTRITQQVLPRLVLFVGIVVCVADAVSGVASQADASGGSQGAQELPRNPAHGLLFAPVPDCPAVQPAPDSSSSAPDSSSSAPTFKRAKSYIRTIDEMSNSSGELVGATSEPQKDEFESPRAWCNISDAVLPISPHAFATNSIAPPIIRDEEDATVDGAPSRRLSLIHHVQKLLLGKGGGGSHGQIAMAPPPLVIQPVEVRRVIREKRCTAGAQLVGDNCISMQQIPPIELCPPNSLHIPQAAGSTCMFRVTPIICCDNPGEVLRAGTCSTMEIAPATLVCPRPELSLENGACVELTQPPPCCPPGFQVDQWQQGQMRCIQVLPHLLKCPDSFERIDNTSCARAHTFAAALVCPEGYTLNSDSSGPANSAASCISWQPLPPTCPPGYQLAESTTGPSRCIRYQPPAIALCPPHASPVARLTDKRRHRNADQLCQYEEDATDRPLLLCPPGYLLSPTHLAHQPPTCIQTLPPPPPHCPLGSILSEQQLASNQVQCLQRVSEIPICPPGMELDFAPGKPGVDTARARCRRQVVHDAVDCCSSGFVMTQATDNPSVVRCEREELIQPVQPAACIGECTTLRIFTPAFVCPDHSDFIDAALGGEPPRCVLPDGSSQPPEMVCPNGGNLSASHGHCELRELLPPPLPTCPVGVFDPELGQCIRRIAVPVKRNCPPGTTFSPPIAPDELPDCVSFEVEQPQFICPSGSVPSPELSGACAVVTPALQATAPIIEKPPLQQCPAPTVLRDGNCVRTVVIPRPFECAPGTVPTTTDGQASLRCQLVVPPIQPPPRALRSKPTFLCPPNSQLADRNGMCIQAETVPAEPCCPPGAQFASEGCLISTEATIPSPRVTVAALPVATCPPGAHLQGQSCIHTYEREPLVSCPPEFQLSVDDSSNQVCLKFTPPTIACPTGSQLEPTSGVCLREIVALALITLREGCIHQSCAAISDAGTPCAASVPHCVNNR